MLVVLLVFVLTVSADEGLTSCAGDVGYHQEGGQWRAVLAVTVPPTFQQGQDWMLEVAVAVQPRQQDLNASLQISENSVQTDDLRPGERLFYRILLPTPDTASLPRVTVVRVNGEQTCNDIIPRGYGYFHVEEELWLNHTLKGNNPTPTLTNVITTTISPPKVSATSKTYVYPATFKHGLLNKDNCGQKSSSSPPHSTNGSVVVESDPESWPWTVLIYNSVVGAAGTGTLVTTQHVITAATSQRDDKRNVISADKFTIYLGITNTNLSSVPESKGRYLQIRKVKATFLHEGFKKFDAVKDNLAVMVLESPVEVTPGVQPVCAWSNRAPTFINGGKGHVVGWDNKTSSVLSQNVPIVSLAECRKSDVNFRIFFRNNSDTFCAGHKNGVGLCEESNGLSRGSALYVEEQEQDGSTHWVLAGIWTLQFFKVVNETVLDECDFNSYVGYIDVFKYSSWLYSIIFPPRDCGESANKVKDLIYNGKETAVGDWPWLAALFYNKYGTGHTFICGGSLISLRHVLTAAHCVSYRNGTEKTSKYDLRVSLGKYKVLDSEPASQSQTIDVSNIFVHRDFFSKYNGNKTDSDLAVLVLDKEAVFTFYVRPICLWHQASPFTETEGTVVGWGKDESGDPKHHITEEPREITLPIVSNKECKDSNHNFNIIVTDKTFCAGTRDGETGPCSGDSGSGMFLPQQHTEGRVTWVLRGVVSRSLKNETTKECVHFEYAVFTDVPKFTAWIRGVMDLPLTDLSDGDLEALNVIKHRDI